MNAKDKYLAFCKTEKELPIFSKNWYLDAVYGEQNWQVAIVEHANEIVAALPYCLKDISFISYIRSDPFTKMLGIYIIPQLHNNKKVKKIITQLIDQLPSVHFFQQNFHYTFTDWLPSKWKGFTQTTRYSYVIDNLKNIEAVWKTIHTNYRNNKIPKAKKELFVSYTLSFEDFYRINKKSFERQNMSIPYSFEKLKRLDEYLVEHDSRKIFFAIDSQQNIHSVAYLIWDKHSAYLHFAGDDPDFRSSGGGILLLWECIKFSSEQLNVGRFDFEGSMIENIEQVRRDFGAKQVPYFQIQKFSSKYLNFIYDLKRLI